jgi:hypothetical protein
MDGWTMLASKESTDHEAWEERGETGGGRDREKGLGTCYRGKGDMDRCGGGKRCLPQHPDGIARGPSRRNGARCVVELD